MYMSSRVLIFNCKHSKSQKYLLSHLFCVYLLCFISIIIARNDLDYKMKFVNKYIMLSFLTMWPIVILFLCKYSLDLFSNLCYYFRVNAYIIRLWNNKDYILEEKNINNRILEFLFKTIYLFFLIKMLSLSNEYMHIHWFPF